MSKIKNIYELKNINIRNKINGAIFIKQKVLIIERFNGKREIVDLINNKDITDTDFDVDIIKHKTKLKRIFVDDLK